MMKHTVITILRTDAEAEEVVKLMKSMSISFATVTEAAAEADKKAWTKKLEQKSFIGK
jgi:hypothetical protein